MAKQKFSYLPSFYKFQDGLLVPSSTASNYSSIFANKDVDVVLNFADNKDKRKPESKQNNALYFDLCSLTGNTTPACDFTFKQDPSSATRFYLSLFKHRNRDLSPQAAKNFTFSGSFFKFDLGWNSPYENVTLINDNTFYDKLYQQKRNWSWQDATHDFDMNKYIKIYNDKLKNFTIEDHYAGYCLETLSSSSLQSVVVKNTASVNIPFEGFNVPNLKTLDLSTCKHVTFATDWAGDLNWNFSDINFSPITKANDFATYFQERFIKKINPDCNIILSPEQEISSWLFPENQNNKYKDHTYKVKDLFPLAKNKDKIIIHPLDLIEIYFTHAKKTISSQMQQLDQYLAKIKSPSQQANLKTK